MISQLEKEITFRFLKTKKNDGFLNIISIFSFIGIALGVAVLIIVMSVMNGFRIELINKIVGFNAHAIVKPYETQINSNLYKSSNFLKQNISSIIFSNEGEAVILNKNHTKGILIKGYLNNDFKELEILKNNEFYGNKELNENSISIGRELSFLLNLDINDSITLMSPTGVETIVGMLPKQEIFKVSSIFDSGLANFNENVAFINLNTLESFFDKESKFRYLEYYFKNPHDIMEYKTALSYVHQKELVYTWADQNESLFSALKVERNVMFIILSLIIVVAAFNIISGLTILVKNKTRDIGILKSIGVTNQSIKKIFFLVGFVIGTTATIFGVFIGTLFAYYIENIREFISNTFNLSLFPEEIYFLNSLPSEINPNSIILVAFCSILTTIIVSIYPAAKASSLDTVKTLKYE